MDCRFSQRALQGLVGGYYNRCYLAELENGYTFLTVSGCFKRDTTGTA